MVQKVIVRGMFHKIVAVCIISLIYAVAAEARVTHEQQIEESLPSDDVSLVAVRAVSGDVRLSSWEQPEVLVKAFKKVTAESSEKAQEYSDKVKIEIERKGDKIEITTEQSLLSALLSQVGVSVEYDIFAPEDIDLDIRSVDGSIYVTGNRGTEKITTVDGDIELRNIVGSVSAKATDGNIYAEVLFDSKSSFFTMSGNIDIHVNDEFSIPISARTLSGSINLTLPEGYSADVDASALSGQVSCDLPFDGSVEKGSLRGTIFGGGPLLKLRAMAGNIAIGAMSEGGREERDPLRTEILPRPEREKTRRPETRKAREQEDLEIPAAEVIKTLNPPVIDGRLDDKCWKSAGRIEDFVWADGIEMAHEPTEAYLLWDDRNFYIGIRCYESHMDTIKISNTEADNDAWADDMVQIFIDTTPDTETDYYHIAVNPIGTVFDQEVDRAYVAQRRIESSKLGAKWNSGGLFDTDIRNDSWSIEAGIPLSVLKAKPEEGDVWRFNMYRMEQRRGEHTYWSPTYARAEWPHVPARFGELVFITAQLIAETPPDISSSEAKGRPAPSEEALTIADITIEGNDTVSQEEIMGALGLRPGDLADVDVLSQAKLRLESLRWFENVGMDLTESDGGADLVVKVTEKEIILPSEVQIRGSVFFTEDQIIDYFNFRPTKVTKEDVNIKCRLIEGLYKSKGYEMAAADSSVISNALVIDIDEGHIDKIKIRGNDKVRIRDIMGSLDLKPGMPYKRAEIDKAVYTMRARLPYFRSVDWEPGRSDDGLNIVYIDVKEDDLIKPRLDAIGEFNRVHGLQLGLGSELKSTYGMARGYCKFSYGFSSEIWNYQLGMEKSWFRKHKATIGIDVLRITDTNDRELVSDVEHFIAEAILGEAWRDFYQRQGYELNFGQELTHSTEFGIRYRNDDYTSLRKTSDWSLLNRSYADDDWYEEFRWIGSTHSREKYRRKGEKYKPENPPIEEGRMKSLIAEYSIDTRNSEKDPTSGWFNTFSAEYAGERFGGDFDFALYQANIRRYNRLSGNQFLAFRIKAATTDRELSPLHPRKFYLGGIGTLRGYSFKEFAGDKMVLINAEYWIMTGWPPGVEKLGIVFFVDSGYTWPYESEMNMDDMKTNIGIGCQLGGLRLNLASPIEEKGKETVLSFRIARMF
jgi:outer membrane protein insertion porin family